jgi:hypothetical protein
MSFVFLTLKKANMAYRVVSEWATTGYSYEACKTARIFTLSAPNTVNYI